MSSRPRRTAAAKAKETISVHAQWANSSDKDLTPSAGGTPTATTTAAMSSRRSGRTSGPSIDVRADSYVDDEDEPMPASTKQRQAARGSIRGRPDPFEGGEIIHGKRDRGGKKSYVVDSSPEDDDDEDEDDEDAQIEVDEDDEEMEDAEGEEDVDMDVDAEGDVDMDIPAPSSGPTIKISRTAAKPTTSRNHNEDDEEEDDDDELSDPGDSDAADQTLGFGDETGLGDDEDAEGDEIEVAGELGGVARAGDSDDEGSQDGEVDLNKMTKRQRARFEDGPQDFMKLSDEVQAKKVFTAEELSMRRQEMARRRRNLSEKRNEEVKMETINKLLKKQAPKVSKKAAGDGSLDEDGPKVSPVFVRWVSNKNGVSVGVPKEIVDGPPGKLFRGGTSTPPLPTKMVEEVA